MNHQYFLYQGERQQDQSIQSVLPSKCDIIQGISAKHMPKIYNETLIIPQNGGVLTCLSLETKEVIWEQTFSKDKSKWIDVFDLLVDNNNLFISIEDQLIKLNTDGKIIEQYSLPTETIANLKISHVHNQKFYSEFYSEEDDQSYFFCYDLKSKSIIWKRLLKEDTTTSSALYNDTLILNLSRNSLIALNLITGDVIWQKNEFGSFTDEQHPSKTSKRPFGFPIIIDDILVNSLFGYTIIGIDLTTGTTKWETKVDEKIPDSLICSANQDIFLIGNSTYCSIDSKNGKKILEKNIGSDFLQKGYIRQTFINLSNDFIHFSDIDKGTFFIINKNSGEVIWKYQCKSSIPLYHYPLITEKEIYLVDDKGNLYVFS